MSAKTICLIGVGSTAELHARAIQRVAGLRIRSCASRNLDKAAAFAARFGIETPRTIDDALARPDADALWVVVPAGEMLNLALRAADSGIPAFFEKPVGLVPRETLLAVERFRAPNMVGLNRRFYEIIRTGKKLIDERGGARFIEVHMPEDIRPLVGRHPDLVLKEWAFVNSVHLIDLFRFFAGNADSVTSANRVRSDWDRSYASLIKFRSGATGIYHAQWYAPGRWRVAVHADSLSIVYAPIEQATVFHSGQAPEILAPQGPDLELKAGFHGQAEAFCALLEKGSLPEGAADLRDYSESVRLVADVTQTRF